MLPMSVDLIFLSLALVCLLIDPTEAQLFKWIIKQSMPADTKFMQYSRDQTYLGYTTSNTIRLDDGVSINFRAQFGPIMNFNITGFTFSQDEQKFVVALRDYINNYTGWMVFNSTIKGYHAVEEQDIMYTSKNDVDYEISSLCFTADNKRVVLGTTNGRISIYNVSAVESIDTKIFDDLPVTALACSPFGSLEFVVGGSFEGKQSILRKYIINPLTNAVELDHQFTISNPLETIYDLEYSSSGNIVYRSSVKLYKYQMGTYEQQAIDTMDGVSNFRDIQISTKEDVLAASTSNNQIYICKNSNGKTEQVVNKTMISQFALSPIGVTLYHMQTETMGELISQCLQNQYLNVTDDACYVCQYECRMCFSVPSACYQCREAYYLVAGHKCLKCMPKCKSCYTGNKCSVCYDPFILNMTDNTCGCQIGKFYNEANNTCDACATNCMACSNGNTCDICNETFSKNAAGVCVCQKGTFLGDGLCRKCSAGCLDCLAQDKCTQCSEDFTLDNGLCSQRQNTGLPGWAIALIVIFIVLAAGVAGFIYIKKKPKQVSLLESEGSEEINSVHK